MPPAKQFVQPKRACAIFMEWIIVGSCSVWRRKKFYNAAEKCLKCRTGGNINAVCSSHYRNGSAALRVAGCRHGNFCAYLAAGQEKCRAVFLSKRQYAG